MSEEKVPAQASIEDQLADSIQTIQWLRDEASNKKKALRERIFSQVYGDGSRGHKHAMEQTAEIVAFILGEDAPAPDFSQILDRVKTFLIDFTKKMNDGIPGISRERYLGCQLTIADVARIVGIGPEIETMATNTAFAYDKLTHAEKEVSDIHAYLDSRGILRQEIPGTLLSVEERIKLLERLGNRTIESTTNGGVRWPGIWLTINGNPIFVQAGDDIKFDRVGFSDEVQNTLEHRQAVRNCGMSTLQVIPDRPMIPLEDLVAWCSSELERTKNMDISESSRGYRNCITSLMQHFGIPERNAGSVWPKTIESVLNLEDLARIVKEIDRRKNGHWELRNGSPVYVVDKSQKSGGGEGSDLEPTA